MHFTHYSFDGRDQAFASLGMGGSSETPDNKKLLEMHKIELFQYFSCTLAVRCINCDYPMYESKSRLKYIGVGSKFEV